jgi:hypothetical protein
MDRRIKVAVDVPVALGSAVVEQATVELHDEGVVLDVAVHDPQSRGRTTLALRAGEPMSPFDPVQVPVLEHRTGSRRHILQYAVQPGSPWRALAGA